MRDYHLLGGCGCITTLVACGLVLFGVVNNLILKMPAGIDADPPRTVGYVIGSLCCCPGPVLLTGLGLLAAAALRRGRADATRSVTPAG